MVANLERRYTLEEYLELDRASEERLEFYDGEICNISGGSCEHATIESNLAYLLGTQLRERSCRAFLGRMRIKVNDSVCGAPYRYGDLSALCGQAIFEKIGGVDVLINPQLVVEVLSSSTEKYDRDVKFKQYQSVESFREYLLVRQDCSFVAQYIKQPNGEWIYRSFDDLSHKVKLESLSCELSLGEIYRNVGFEDLGTQQRELFNQNLIRNESSNEQ